MSRMHIHHSLVKSGQFSNLCIPRYNKNPGPSSGDMIHQCMISADFGLITWRSIPAEVGQHTLNSRGIRLQHIVWKLKHWITVCRFPYFLFDQHDKLWSWIIRYFTHTSSWQLTERVENHGPRYYCFQWCCDSDVYVFDWYTGKGSARWSEADTNI